MDSQILDDLEKSLLEDGYEFVTEKVITEQTEPTNPQKVYLDVKQLSYDLKQLDRSMRYLGFAQDVVIRIKFVDNKYVAKIFAKD